MPETRSKGGIAAGTIRPARFVKAGTDEGDILEGTASSSPIGISFKETRRSDYVDSTASPGVLALVNEPLSYYTAGAECYLEIGGTVATGDYLVPTTNGVGITTTTNNAIYGAKALRPGVSGEIIPVEVIIGFYGA